MTSPAVGAHELRFSRDGVAFVGRVDVPATVRARAFLVHGLGEHLERQQAIVDRLLALDIACARFDLRGHGRSGGKRGDAPSIDAVLDDLAAFADRAAALLPAAPSFLYGQSLGGLLVLCHVLRRGARLGGVELRGAIASSPALRTTAPPPRWKVLFGRALRHVWPSVTLANGLDPKDLSHDPAVAREVKQDGLGHRRISARFGLDLLDAGRRALAHRGPLPCPVLLAHGTADHVTDFAASREFASAHPGVELVPVEGGYHELHHEPDPRPLFDAVARFVARHAGAD